MEKLLKHINFLPKNDTVRETFTLKSYFCMANTAF